VPHAANDPISEPVIASFRFGPTFRMFATLWWLAGPLPFTLLVVHVARGGDPVLLFVYLFLAAIPVPLVGLALWRSRVEITQQHVIVRRLRSPLFCDRSRTKLEVTNIGGTPVTRISDGAKTRDIRSVTAMRRGARKLRELAAYVPVTIHGRDVEPMQ